MTTIPLSRPSLGKLYGETMRNFDPRFPALSVDLREATALEEPFLSFLSEIGETLYAFHNLRRGLSLLFSNNEIPANDAVLASMRLMVWEAFNDTIEALSMPAFDKLLNALRNYTEAQSEACSSLPTDSAYKLDALPLIVKLETSLMAFELTGIRESFQ